VTTLCRGSRPTTDGSRSLAGGPGTRRVDDLHGRCQGHVTVGCTLNENLHRPDVTGKTRGVVVVMVRELKQKRDTGILSAVSTPTVA
jgi:hypothetical protein